MTSFPPFISFFSTLNQYWGAFFASCQLVSFCFKDPTRPRLIMREFFGSKHCTNCSAFAEIPWGKPICLLWEKLFNLISWKLFHLHPSRNPLKEIKFSSTNFVWQNCLKWMKSWGKNWKLLFLNHRKMRRKVWRREKRAYQISIYFLSSTAITHKRQGGEKKLFRLVGGDSELPAFWWCFVEEKIIEFMRISIGEIEFWGATFV